MTKKFNSKLYQGKKRVYVKVPLSPNISRLYIWDESACEYLAPSRGKNYIASRRRSGEKRVKQFFRSVEEARIFLRRSSGAGVLSWQRANMPRSCRR